MTSCRDFWTRTTGYASNITNMLLLFDSMPVRPSHKRCSGNHTSICSSVPRSQQLREHDKLQKSLEGDMLDVEAWSIHLWYRVPASVHPTSNGSPNDFESGDDRGSYMYCCTGKVSRRKFSVIISTNKRWRMKLELPVTSYCARIIASSLTYISVFWLERNGSRSSRRGWIVTPVIY